MRIRLDTRSAATIFAALRAFQQLDAFAGGLPAKLESIATNNGAFERLDKYEIDELCERILPNVQQS